MKTKYTKQAGSILLAVLLGVSGVMGTGCLAAAEEETDAVSAETELETDVDAADETAIEITELEVSVGEEILAVANATGVTVESASAEESGDEEITEDTDSETADSGETDAAATTLIFTTEDGMVHTFEITDVAELTGLTELTLTEKIGFFFLYGTDSNGDAKYYYEEAGEITLEDSVTMYTTGQVTVRENADGSSEALGYVDRGSKVEVLGGTSAWFLVSQGELTGYVAARYLTVDESEAQAAVEAEETAQAAQQAAIAAAAAAAAAAASSAQSSSSSSSTDSGSSSASQTETTSTDNACLTGGVLN